MASLCSTMTSAVAAGAESDPSEATATSENGKSEEELVFGATNNAEEIANHLCQRLQKAVVHGVSSLPMLDKPDLLVDKIQKPYIKNIDVLEIYCMRNIFSLDMYNLSHRRAILNVLLQGEAATKPALNGEEDKVTAAVFNDHMEPLTSLPSLEEVPSAQDLQSLQAQTEALRQRLSVLKAQQSLLLSELHEWKVATELVESAQVDRSNLHESVSAAVIGSEGLEQVHQKSLQLMKQLEEKRAHCDDDDDGDGDRLIRTKKQLTLEERFVLERRIVSGASFDSLKLLNQRIPRGKENESE